MANILINRDKCIGCGQCQRDCLCDTIYMDEGKARVGTKRCIKCGHCIAICPKEAITLGNIENINWDQNNPGMERGRAPEPEAFLDFLKFRRSIRHYKNQDIEAEKLDMIIEAGRYAPTASNRQKNSFIILRKNIGQVRKAAVKTLYDAAANKERPLGEREMYRQSWMTMYDDLERGKGDRLFFDAPAVILIVTDKKAGSSDIDAGIAASRMELQANALGLGVCYIGFLSTAIEFDDDVRKQIGIGDDERMAVAFTVGYPDVKYFRPVPRKPADVRIL